MDGRIIGIAIDIGMISAAKRRIEQKKQFTETCQRLGYSVEQINQAITDTSKVIADFIKSLHGEENDEPTS